MPALPTEYTQAFDDLPFGVVDKIGIAFSSDIFGECRANTIITSHQDQDTDHFGMGLAKIAGTADDEHVRRQGSGARAGSRRRRGVQCLCRASSSPPRSARTRRPPSIGPHIIAWGSDPLTMGSYSAARVGKVGARATLAEPLDDRLYFAGEAISTNAHSSLHGAYLTGQSAAKSIVDHLGAAQ